MEVIGKDKKTGEYVPFYYVKQDNNWVLSRTFQGNSVQKACMNCHSAIGNSTVFTPMPLKVIQTAEGLQKVGYSINDSYGFHGASGGP